MHPLLDPSLRPVVGHRGNRAHAPENTLESFRQAVALGADALEMDVHLTADGEVVVIHDPTVDRTTDGRGRVDAMSLAQLRALDAGARFTADGGGTHPYRGRGIGISTFAEVLEEIPSRVPLLIEIKTPKASARLREVIEAHDATSRCIVESFDPAAGAPFAGSSIEVGASQAQVASLLLPALLGRTTKALPYRFMAIPRRFNGIPLPVGALARAAQRGGALVHVWTVNDAQVALDLWRVGVRAIITDEPARILAAPTTASFGAR